MENFAAESERIRRVYENRTAKIFKNKYSWKKADAHYMTYRKATSWSCAFKSVGIDDLTKLEILDIGCGTGSWLRMLLEWDADKNRLHGIDLLEDKIKSAKVLSPCDIDFKVNSNWQIPYQDNTMDLCAASTVFSSILEDTYATRLAHEIKRVTKKSGWIMIFDFAISDPKNPNTTGISTKKIQALFSGFSLLHTYRLILAPPILRRLPRSLLWIGLLLETIFPFLCTHRLYLLHRTD